MRYSKLVPTKGVRSERDERRSEVKGEKVPSGAFKEEVKRL